MGGFGYCVILILKGYDSAEEMQLVEETAKKDEDIQCILFRTGERTESHEKVALEAV